MTQRYNPRITREASKDLIAIHAHIEADSPQNATLVIERLLSAIESLSSLPYRYPIHRHSRKLNLVVRSMPVQPYIVYYRIVEDGKVIRVLTIRHGARRTPSRFR